MNPITAVVRTVRRLVGENMTTPNAEGYWIVDGPIPWYRKGGYHVRIRDGNIMLRKTCDDVEFPSVPEEWDGCAWTKDNPNTGADRT